MRNLIIVLKVLISTLQSWKGKRGKKGKRPDMVIIFALGQVFALAFLAWALRMLPHVLK